MFHISSSRSSIIMALVAIACALGPVRADAGEVLPGPMPARVVEVVDGASRDPLTSAGRRIYALLQGESGLADGDTILTTTPDRVQVSFVRANAAGDDLEACPVAGIQGRSPRRTAPVRGTLRSAARHPHDLDREEP